MPDGFVWAPPQIDWRSPDYFVGEFRRRAAALHRIRAARKLAEKERKPDPLISLRRYYQDNPPAFICDWGCTVDPRNVERGLPVMMPFVLWPKQVECCHYILRKWRAQEPGLIEKSRDVGFTWLAISLACSMCALFEGMRIGFGSRKAEYVDQLNDQKSILQKGREFMRLLPIEFRAGWTLRDHAPHMRMAFPDTGSTIGGEAGAAIGRGDRTGLYLVDEFAHFEPADAKGADAALSMTTNCRIDASSVNGMNNAFAEKRHSGRIEVFVLDWRDDPRKDREWYERKKAIEDPVVFAQEVDRDYRASSEGLVIPGEWVQAAVDAHERLGVAPRGALRAALDIADEGRDQNAICFGRGVVIEHLDEWSGKGSDTFVTVERAFVACDERGVAKLRYDSDGLGAAVRGDARVINERRKTRGRRPVEVEAFRGSSEVLRKDEKVDGFEDSDREAPTNGDFFANLKAQQWWALRRKFQRTHRAITQGGRFDADEIISISSSCAYYQRLLTELTQPTRTFNGAGKMVVNKTPEGAKSPNLADAVMMWSAAGKTSWLDKLSDAAVSAI